MRVYGVMPAIARGPRGVRPGHALSYEHMFPSSPPAALLRCIRRPRLGRALALARSFLLLEDDYDVDWEVDQDGQGRRGAGRWEPRERAVTRKLAVRADGARHESVRVHPHRVWLRGRPGRERAGQPEPSMQALQCLCPRAGRPKVRYASDHGNPRPRSRAS